MTPSATGWSRATRPPWHDPRVPPGARCAPCLPPRSARLLEGTADDPLGTVYAVAVGTGLRLGELLGLEWTDVDLAARQLTVRRSMARPRRRIRARRAQDEPQPADRDAARRRGRRAAPPEGPAGGRQARRGFRVAGRGRARVHGRRGPSAAPSRRVRSLPGDVDQAEARRPAARPPAHGCVPAPGRRRAAEGRERDAGP